MNACLMDTANNFTLGAAGSFDPTTTMGWLSVAADVFGGGINPVGDAFGTSSYFSVSDTGLQNPSSNSMAGAGLTGIATGTGFSNSMNMAARSSTKGAFGKGVLNGLFGQGVGNTLSKGGVLGKAIPLVGLYFAAKGASEFKKNCEQRCEKFR